MYLSRGPQPTTKTTQILPAQFHLRHGRPSPAFSSGQSNSQPMKCWPLRNLTKPPLNVRSATLELPKFRVGECLSIAQIAKSRSTFFEAAKESLYRCCCITPPSHSEQNLRRSLKALRCRIYWLLVRLAPGGEHDMPNSSHHNESPWQSGCLLLAFAIFDSLGTVPTLIRYGPRYVRNEIEILPVYLMVAVVGWLLAIHIRYPLQGRRRFACCEPSLAIGTAIGPVFLLTPSLVATGGQIFGKPKAQVWRCRCLSVSSPPSSMSCS